MSDDELYVYVAEGWWSPNAVSGKVHDHPTGRPGRGWSPAMHRSCELVYTRRLLPERDATLCACGHDRSAHRLGYGRRCVSCTCPSFLAWPTQPPAILPG